MQRHVAARYPGARLITLDDLAPDDEGLFHGDHGDACPGLAEVDFYGDRRPTLALVLLTKRKGSEVSILVVAHKLEKGWLTTELDTGGQDVPVVWGESAGKYTDVYGNKTVRATRPVIVFCKYEAWAILYAWTGTRVTKIWLRD